jgi:hypothetical protein
VKPTRHRNPTRLVAIVLIAAFGVAACDSQPSTKRVAEDLVKSLPGATDAERDCMLEIIENDYTADELDDIGNGVTEGDPESVAALEKFERDLASCR